MIFELLGLWFLLAIAACGAFALISWREEVEQREREEL